MSNVSATYGKKQNQLFYSPLWCSCCSDNPGEQWCLASSWFAAAQGSSGTELEGKSRTVNNGETEAAMDLLMDVWPGVVDICASFLRAWEKWLLLPIFFPMLPLGWGSGFYLQLAMSSWPVSSVRKRVKNPYSFWPSFFQFPVMHWTHYRTCCMLQWAAGTCLNCLPKAGNQYSILIVRGKRW